MNEITIPMRSRTRATVWVSLSPSHNVLKTTQRNVAAFESELELEDDAPKRGEEVERKSHLHIAEV